MTQKSWNKRIKKNQTKHILPQNKTEQNLWAKTLLGIKELKAKSIFGENENS